MCCTVEAIQDSSLTLHPRLQRWYQIPDKLAAFNFKPSHKGPLVFSDKTPLACATETRLRCSIETCVLGIKRCAYFPDFICLLPASLAALLHGCQKAMHAIIAPLPRQFKPDQPFCCYWTAAKLDSSPALATRVISLGRSCKSRSIGKVSVSRQISAKLTYCRVKHILLSCGLPFKPGFSQK